ncbi:CDGSH iron-sulfur domain-containing protein 3, mitochondrial-like [Sphaeramia orbicularis]|uniref:CDGSH iron-sulfur domain-containing protein 3, mitochondrial-like n=1 Tax=Sphaeramia orbicularis TaxID=375764 RepID=A0A672Y7V5_9TELE|nr:CDGSH iron-sulfur domain-containing protein 3, mitochondrial-like [Sphaeramia orbicularis]
MNWAGFSSVVLVGWTRTFSRPPAAVCASWSRVQHCWQSTQPVPAARIPYRIKVSAGKRYAWCACGHSKKQPFCDGAHRSKAPDISPVRFTPEKDQRVMLCACKQTKNAPYCDGSHFRVIYQDVVKSIKGIFK